MNVTRWLTALAGAALLTAATAASAQTLTRYVKYEVGGHTAWGLLEGDTIRDNKLKLIGRHNGNVVQETTTDLLIFSIDNIVSYTSRYITLEPGDVIFTGTPGTTQAMKPGDTFEVEIEGIGVLRNKVVAEKP